MSENLATSPRLLLDGDRIIGVTVDEHIVALNAASGKEV